MSLYETLGVLRRHKILVLTGVFLGLILAAFSLYRPVRLESGWDFVRTSRTTYQSTVNLMIDLPGYGLGRADVSMEKPASMAPTFAFMVTSDDVKERIERQLGSLDEVSLTARSIDRSPVFQIIAEGDNAERVQLFVKTAADSLVESVLAQQDDNAVPAQQRMEVLVMGAPSTPEVLQSRDAEIAGILFLAPIVLFGWLGFVMEGLRKAQDIENAGLDEGGRHAPDRSTIEAGEAPASPNGASASATDSPAMPGVTCEE